MTERNTVNLIVNGRPVSEPVSTRLLLVDFLHEQLDLTGTKATCHIGLCKVCTVATRAVGGKQYERTQACITPVVTLNQHEVVTVEGLTNNGKLSLLQQTFLSEFAFQCGYCTPGFLMGAVVLMDTLKHEPIEPDQLDEFIETHLGDHICRCTGYTNYYKAIKKVVLATPGLTT